MIEIDTESPEPIFEQIIGQIGMAIQEGKLKEGDKLPPIRQLSTDLEINPNTVAKAYQILEEFNVIETFGRSGCIITPRALENFENWLIKITKEKLHSSWSKILALSPNKSIARKIWKQSIKELRDG